MLKVSVIIPVYNTDQYLAACIESLVQQSLQEIEFIFVNDGSSDKSRLIIEKYQKEDLRIKLIDQENKGVSKARNVGLEMAIGKYIGFTDADDIVDKDMFEKMYLVAEANDVDLVSCNIVTKQEGIKKIIKNPFPKNKVLDQNDVHKEIIPFMIKSDQMNSCCNKIYLSSKIKNNRLLFPVDLTHGEDAYFNLQYFNSAKNVFFIDDALYYYREVLGSASRNFISNNYFQQAVDVYKSSYNFEFNLSENEIEKLKSIRFINKVLPIIFMIFTSSSKVSLRKRFSLVNDIVKNKTLIKVVNKFWHEIMDQRTRYEKFIIKNIRSKSVILLYLASIYSKYRNRI